MDESTMIKFKYIVSIFAIFIQNFLLAEEVKSIDVFEELNRLFDNVFKDNESLTNTKSVWKTESMFLSPVSKRLIPPHEKVRSQSLFKLVYRNGDELSFPFFPNENIEFEEMENEKFIRFGNNSLIIGEGLIEQLLVPIAKKFSNSPELSDLNIDWEKYSRCSYKDIINILSISPSKKKTLSKENISSYYTLFLKGLLIETLFAGKPLFCIEGETKQIIFSYYEESGISGFIFTKEHNYQFAYICDLSGRKSTINDVVNSFVWFLLKGTKADRQEDPETKTK
jgi:hypothetical protein